ncbi:MAG: hypothetical protein ACPGQD_01010 [Planctomycetota bacterium]
MAIYEGANIDKKYTDLPRTHLNPGEYGGYPHFFQALIDFTTDHDDGDQVLVMELPSNFVVTQLLIRSDGANSAGVLDLGVYSHNGKEGGTWTLTEPVSGNQDHFGAAVAIATALTDWTDITLDGDHTLADCFVPLWQAIGLSEDPGGTLMLVAEIETADIDVAAKVGFLVRGFR